MAEKRAGRLPRESAPHPTPERGATSSCENGSWRKLARLARLGERIEFYCAVCGHEADATYTDKLGRPEWLIGSHNIRCRERGGKCLVELAAHLGTTAPDLKNDPRPYLGSARGRRREGPPAPLPNGGTIDGWHSRLLATREPLAYLIDGRGLSLETVGRHRIGWDGRHLTFPIFGAGGDLLNLQRRLPVDGAAMRGLFRRGSQLYPDVPRRGPLLLVAGELDALLGRQHGLRAVTTTCGARVPDALLPPLAGRTVAIAFDVGEEAAAETTAAKLRVAGSEAWVVRLGLLGLPEKGDLSDYLRAEGSAAEVRTLVRDERRRR